VSHSDTLDRLRQGLEAKYWAEETLTPRLQEKLDLMWQLSYESTSDWATNGKEEIQGIKDYYAQLVNLVNP
jgi:hypothetical protein